MNKFISFTAAALVVASLAGCATQGQTGALAGGVGGAGVGAAVGGTKGALIGGAIGSVGGALIGNEADKQRQMQQQPQRRCEDIQRRDQYGRTYWDRVC